VRCIHGEIFAGFQTDGVSRAWSDQAHPLTGVSSAISPARHDLGKDCGCERERARRRSRHSHPPCRALGAVHALHSHGTGVNGLDKNGATSVTAPRLKMAVRQSFECCKSTRT
jgi:hypothetical protein